MQWAGKSNAESLVGRMAYWIHVLRAIDLCGERKDPKMWLRMIPRAKTNVRANSVSGTSTITGTFRTSSSFTFAVLAYEARKLDAGLAALAGAAIRGKFSQCGLEGFVICIFAHRCCGLLALAC